MTVVPSPVAPERDTPMSPVAQRMVARFRRMLADMFPTADTLDRYRESDGADTGEHPIVMCSECHVFPVAFRSKCFTCQTKGRPAA